MELKVDFDNDFGFTTVDRANPKELQARDDKLQEIWNMVKPLLDNLMKDPEKDIHWPDRDKKIGAFREKLRVLIFEKP